MPKAGAPTSSKRRHNPLEQDLLATGILTSKKSKRPKRTEEDGDHFIDSRSSRKILDLAAEQEAEDAKFRPTTAQATNSAFDFAVAEESPGDNTFEEDDDDAWGEEDEVEEEEVDAADLSIFNKFNPSLSDDPPLLWEEAAGNSSQQTTSVNLGDLILAKLADKKGLLEPSQDTELPDQDHDHGLPSKVVDVFTKIGEILHRYRSGPLPKPFKVLPTIPHFEQVLEVTAPDNWSPNAVAAATRIFISAKPAVATRFVEIVLLERIRDEIRETRRLNVHLFNSLKKSLYRPAAFFKGFLFPLVASGTATQREATIISAALIRTSIPVLHSAAALKTLCDIAAEQTPRSSCFGATNIFIKVLLEKKYALPYQVIDSLVFYFIRSRDQSRDAAGEHTGADAISLPVLWHLALLAFAQRYRNDITEDQREALMDLLLAGNEKIIPEIRRELLAGRGRGVAIEPMGPAFDGDDTMLVD